MSISFKWALREYQLEESQRVLVFAKIYRGEMYQLPVPIWGMVSSLATGGMYFYVKVESDPHVELQIPTCGFFLEDEVPQAYHDLLESQGALKPRVLEFLKATADWRSVSEIFDSFNKEADADISLCLVQLMTEGHVLFHEDMGFAFDH